jgi:16S rRNA (cytosine1402-N4)-methyltransferase
MTLPRVWVSWASNMPGHIPVLATEIIAQFAPKNGDRLLDATLGLGGHTKAFLEAAENTTVVGFDADAEALAVAKQNLKEFGERVTFVHQNFGTLKDSSVGGGILREEGFSHVLFDLGVGSHQLDDAVRAFSFSSTGPLSMQFGMTAGLPPAQVQGLNYLEQRLGHPPDVAEIIQKLHEDELADVLYRYGDERYSRLIARALKQSPLPATGKQLAERIADAVPNRYMHGRIHPATRTFQALRMAANRELEVLEAALPQAADLLKSGGMLGVISFHSGEDRIVKRFIKSATTIKAVTKKPIVATPEECAKNPRARSAKLRLARKT